jgi:hypothetical protein
MSFSDRLKAGAAGVGAKTKEGAEDAQLKLEFEKAQKELGAKTYELIESGTIKNEELEPIAARMRDLKAKRTKPT